MPNLNHAGKCWPKRLVFQIAFVHDVCTFAPKANNNNYWYNVDSHDWLNKL